MNEHAFAVIIAGGRGERFWPLSTAAPPKQFLSLFGGKPLIRHSFDRLVGFVPPERILVITSADLVDTTAQALPSLPACNIVGEPCGRDTAAACALACGLVAARDPEGVVAILAADHLMADVEGFHRTLRDSYTVAAAGGCIVTIGVKPTFPSTGFGYIEAGDDLAPGLATPFSKALRFVEKPDAETAAGYLASGRFFWNAGMFIWPVRTMRDAVGRFVPDLLPLVGLPLRARSPEALAPALADIYPGLRKISVDYAIMEHFDNIVMAHGDFGWDDVGTWPSAATHFDADAEGNVVIGKAETLDASGNFVVSEGRLTALFGVRDLIVVQAGNATLVCPRDRAPELKKLVQQIGRRPDGSEYV